MTVAEWFNPGLGTKRPAGLRWRASKQYTLFVVAFAVFTDMFLYGMIVPVAPNAMQERVGLPASEQQRWTSILLALYGASLFAIAPFTGWIADRINSRQWPLLTGLVALALATALLCIGTNLALWISGRILQGASTAVVWTAGLAMLSDSMDSKELGQSMGYIGMSMTTGIMVGPLIGGVLYQKGGYYSVFGLSFGFLALDIVFRLVMIERRHVLPWLKAEQDEPSEVTRNENSLSENPSKVHVRPDNDHHESRGPTPVSTAENTTYPGPPKPTRLFGNIWTLMNSSSMIIVVWGYLIIALVLTSFDSVLPLFVRDTFGWKQTGQGLIFIPLSIPSLLEPLVGFMVDRWPRLPRYIVAAALLCSVPCLVTLRFVTHNTMSQKVLLCALLALIGLCLACLMPPVMVEVTYIVQRKEAEASDIFGKGGAMALAYGLLNSAWAAGTIIGPFFAGFIRDSAGWGTMAWSLSILVGVTVVPALLFLGGPISSSSEDQA